MPPSLHPTEKVKSYLTIVGISLSLVASIYAGVSVIWGKLGNVVTRDGLIEHDLDKDSHPPLRTEQEFALTQANLAIKRVEELREDQVMMMARLVRLVAADFERDVRKKSMRATLAEQAFRRQVLHGESLEGAFLSALEDTRGIP